MTDTDAAREAVLARLDAARRARERADKAVENAAREQEGAVVAAYLARGITVAEMARRVGLSDSYVRAIRREHNIPANPSYAGIKPPTRGEVRGEDD